MSVETPTGGERSEYDWGSYEPLGEDTTDYSEDERIQIGAGWLGSAV
jgi:hypothetical protein